LDTVTGRAGSSVKQRMVAVRCAPGGVEEDFSCILAIEQADFEADRYSPRVGTTIGGFESNATAPQSEEF
jgi:hypothetical protein